MTIFDLKLIACISMILDHIKYAIPATSGVLTLYFGRIAFPLFCFVAVQGYLHTSDFKKYIQRLILFGIISQIPYALFLTIIPTDFSLNIMFTLLLGLLSVYCVDKIENVFCAALSASFLIFLGYLLKVDYGWFGVTLILLMYMTRNNKIVFSICYILCVLIFYLVSHLKFDMSLFIPYLPYILCTIFPLAFMLAYNGNLGKKLKYFYYWFYPVHLFAFYLISFCNIV